MDLVSKHDRGDLAWTRIGSRVGGALAVDLLEPQRIVRVGTLSGPEFIERCGWVVDPLYSEVVAGREGLIVECSFGTMSALGPWRIVDGGGHFLGSQMTSNSEDLLSQLVKLSVVRISVRPSGLVSDLNLTLINGWVLEFYSMSELEAWELSVMEGRECE